MILGIIDHDRGALDPLSLQMLAFARGLAGQLGLPVHAVVLGDRGKELAEALGHHGVETVHVVVHEALDDYAPAAWAQGVLEIVDEIAPDAVLAPGSDRGHEVAAHLGAKGGLPFAANCVRVEPAEDADAYLVTRQRWGGSLLEEARLVGVPKLFTVAPHAIAAAEVAPAATLAVETHTPSLTEADLLVRVVERIGSAGGKVSLAEARVVVGAGRGVGGPEGFADLEELAALLGGTVGVSRVVTSAGWRPHSDQVGQTGTRIAPDIYIACGISGAIQHMVGCKAAKRILAINSDPDAPIMAKADQAIVGDLHAVVPALIAEIKRSRGAS
jgi:electron transfer flavoprotein alpha subunit